MTPRDALLKELTQSKYNQLANEQGDLFEVTDLPLSPKEKRYLRFNLWATRLCLLAVAPTVSLYFVAFEDGETFVAGLIILPLSLLFGYYLNRNYTQMFARGTKTKFRGVITDKKMEKDDEDEKYEFTLSNKVQVLVGAHDYKKLNFGDVIEVECFVSRDMNLGKEVKFVGKILD